MSAHSAASLILPTSMNPKMNYTRTIVGILAGSIIANITLICQSRFIFFSPG